MQSAFSIACLDRSFRTKTRIQVIRIPLLVLLPSVVFLPRLYFPVSDQHFDRAFHPSSLCRTRRQLDDYSIIVHWPLVISRCDSTLAFSSRHIQYKRVWFSAGCFKPYSIYSYKYFDGSAMIRIINRFDALFGISDQLRPLVSRIPYTCASASSQ